MSIRFTSTYIKTIFLTSIASLLLIPHAQAETDSGTVTGNVGLVEEVSYDPPALINLNSDPVDGQAYDFGTVHIQSNDTDGWELEVKSANGSVLKNSSDNSIPYTDLNSRGPGAVGQINLSNADTGALMARSSDLLCISGCDISLQTIINAATVRSSPAGNYSDVLTFTFINN